MSTVRIFDVLSYNFQTLEMYSENYMKKYGLVTYLHTTCSTPILAIKPYRGKYVPYHKLCMEHTFYFQQPTSAHVMYC
jgi:hypothetical protein